MWGGRLPPARRSAAAAPDWLTNSLIVRERDAGIRLLHFTGTCNGHGAVEGTNGPIG
jgi:hypothetical protein